MCVLFINQLKKMFYLVDFRPDVFVLYMNDVLEGFCSMKGVLPSVADFAFNASVCRRRIDVGMEVTGGILTISRNLATMFWEGGVLIVIHD